MDWTGTVANNQTVNKEITASTNPEPGDDAPEQMRIRAEKCAWMFGTGNISYLAHMDITTTIIEIRERHPNLETGGETDDLVGAAGRVRLTRSSSKLVFATLQEGNGNTIQITISQGEIGSDSLTVYKANVDFDDHLYIHGRMISSKHGELSTFVDKWQLTYKPLRPLSKTYTNDKREEATLSEDTRIHQCYLDMITRPAARDMVRNCTRVMQPLWRYLDECGHIEVETPIL